MLGVIAIFACLGHIFPLYFGFKGGKAVATAFGAMLPIGLDFSRFAYFELGSSGVSYGLFFIRALILQ